MTKSGYLSNVDRWTFCVNKFFMDEREILIVEAAIRVITRYGVRRTTMNDIASAAGIARQTLYNVFDNKDDVLRATMRYFAARSADSIVEAWENERDLGRRLDILFHHMVVVPYAMVRSAPDADDIISGFSTAACQELAEADERYRRILTEGLEPFGETLKAHGTSPSRLADLVQRAAIGLKKSATSPEHLQDLLATLKLLVLNLALPRNKDAQ